METLVAYYFERADSGNLPEAGRKRVEEYKDWWQGGVVHNGHDAHTVGLHVWDRGERDCL